MLTTVPTATAEASAVSAAPHDAKMYAVRREMRREYNEWMEALSKSDGQYDYPDVRAPGGLPTGWTIRHHSPTRAGGGLKSITYVVSRDAGGWAMVHYNINPSMGGNSYTTLGDWEPTLMGLYAYTCKQADVGSFPAEGYLRMECLLRPFIAEHYNTDDPTEAAEATLVALGARPQLLPAVLKT